MDIKLHEYWRSSASYRLRIALNLKGVAYQSISYDLRKAAHQSADYRAINPQGLVPALEADGTAFGQSPAVLEWLEERYPAPALLPQDIAARAQVRAMAALICCDIHPLCNLRILNSLRADFGASDADIAAWIARWISDGFTALETMIASRSGPYCFGEMVTLADCCLVPQVYNAHRFGVDLSPFPRITACNAHCLDLEAFADAQPERHVDAD